MNPTLLGSFNTWVEWAQEDLRDLPSRNEAPRARALRLGFARVTLTNALNAANRLRCPARRAVCLRVLNWISADLRRLAA